MEQKQITNLVFQGGSVKGIAYIGACSALETKIDMTKIKRVAGTSAGAITAATIALGCDANTLQTTLLNFDFKNLLDDQGVNTSEKLLKSVGKSEQGVNPFFSKVPAKTVKVPMLHRILTQYGVYEGEYFREWAEKFIQDRIHLITNGKYDGVHLTFSELHALTLNYPQLKDLYVVGVNLNTGKKVIFSHDNPDPNIGNVIISDAIRISMSIPIIFKPHHIHYKINGQRLVDAQRHIFVDGGLYENYPIRCFDKVGYYSQKDTIQNNNSIFFNPETLGFRLVSEEKKDYFEGINDDAPENEINGMIDYAKAILHGLMARQDDDHDLIPEDKERTIYIDHLGVSTLAFDLNQTQQTALIQSGQYSVDMYFDGVSQVPKPSLLPIQTTTNNVPVHSRKCCIL